MIQLFIHKELSIKSKVVDSFDMVFRESFKRANYTGQLEVLNKINSFVQRRISQAFEKNRLEIVDQFIFLPCFFYEILANKNDLRLNLVRTNTLFFKTLSVIFRSSRFSEEVNKLAIDRFLHGVISYYHLVIEKGDEEELKYAFNELKQMGSHNPDYYRFRSELLRDLRQGHGEEVVQNKRQNQLAIFHYDNSLRRVGLILQSWLIYLYSTNKIDANRLNLVYPMIKIHYQFFEDLVEDLLYVKKHEYHGYLGLSHWDNEVRSSGITYTPPSPNHWILHGFLSYLLTLQKPHVFIGLVNNSYNFSYLYDEINRMLDYYKKNIKKWNEFFKIRIGADSDLKALITLFEQSEKDILSIFEQLKIRFENSKDEGIAKQPLSPKLVEAFKSQLYERWKNQCTSFDLFDAHNNINILTNDNNLRTFGRKYFLERSKMMFVEEGKETIYGISNIGADEGRSINDNFIGQLLKNKKKDEVYQVIVGIDGGLKRLKGNGYFPNQIIVPPEFSYKTDLKESEDFVPSWSIENNENNVKSISNVGFFKDIPIATFNSSLLSNQIIITEFNRAFELNIIESKEFVGRRLHLSIKKLMRSEINSKFQENPDKWLYDDQGFKLSEEQAKTRIATSINLEIWAKGKFKIIDCKAYEVFLLKDNL